MIASPANRVAGLKIMTETERRHKKAWEIWSPTQKTQVMFSNDKKRRKGSVIAERLGVGGHLFESRSPVKKEPLSPALRKSLNDTSSTSANGYWQQLAQSRETGIITPIAKVNEPVKKLRKEAAKKPVQKARSRRTSCLGGDLYREQMFQARCKENQEKRRLELKDTLRNRIGKMDVVQAFRTWDTNGDGTLSKAELSSGLDKLGLSLLKGDFDTLFTEMDANGNGLVEINELEHFMGRVGTNTDRGDNRYAYSLHLV
jgi:hypothetical protein